MGLNPGRQAIHIRANFVLSTTYLFISSALEMLLLTLRKYIAQFKGNVGRIFSFKLGDVSCSQVMETPHSEVSECHKSIVSFKSYAYKP